MQHGLPFGRGDHRPTPKSWRGQRLDGLVVLQGNVHRAGRCARLPEAERQPPQPLPAWSELPASTRTAYIANNRLGLRRWFLAACLDERVPCGAFSRMRNEGFPFIIWWSGGYIATFFATFSHRFSHRFSRRFRVVNSVSMGKAAKPRSFWCAHFAVSME